MKAFCITDVGQNRSMNQDFVFASETPVGNLPNLFVVADGMGGHRAGDTASRDTVGTLIESVRKSRETNPIKIIRTAVEEANRRVYEKSREDETVGAVGTVIGDAGEGTRRITGLLRAVCPDHHRGGGDGTKRQA